MSPRTKVAAAIAAVAACVLALWLVTRVRDDESPPTEKSRTPPSESTEFESGSEAKTDPVPEQDAVVERVDDPPAPPSYTATGVSAPWETLGIREYVSELQKRDVPTELQHAYDNLINDVEITTRGYSALEGESSEGIIMNGFFYNGRHHEPGPTGGAWGQLLAAVCGDAATDADIQRFGDLMVTYTRLAYEEAVEVDKSFELGDSPLDSPNMREAWNARLYAYEGLHSQLFRDLRASLSRPAQERFFSFWDAVIAPTLKRAENPAPMPR